MHKNLGDIMVEHDMIDNTEVEYMVDKYICGNTARKSRARALY